MGRHPPRQGLQGRRGAPDRVRLERLPAGEHQHHERAGEQLAEEHRGEDGEAGEPIRAEVLVHGAAGQVPQQRQPAHQERRHERQIRGPDGPE